MSMLLQHEHISATQIITIIIICVWKQKGTFTDADGLSLSTFRSMLDVGDCKILWLSDSGPVQHQSAHSVYTLTLCLRKNYRWCCFLPRIVTYPGQV